MPTPNKNAAPPKKKCDVFIGWSDRGGDRFSKASAHLLERLIKKLVPTAEVFVSDNSIRGGEPWFKELSGHAKTARWGFFCISESNYGARWMAFEAGLIHAHGGSVIPVLVGAADSTAMKDSPFDQFQFVSPVSAGKVEELVKVLGLIRHALDGRPDSLAAFALNLGDAAVKFSTDYLALLQQCPVAGDAQKAKLMTDLDPKVRHCLTAVSHLALTLEAALPENPEDDPAKSPAKVIQGEILDVLIKEEWDLKKGRLKHLAGLWEQLDPFIVRTSERRLKSEVRKLMERVSSLENPDSSAAPQTAGKSDAAVALAKVASELEKLWNKPIIPGEESGTGEVGA